MSDWVEIVIPATVAGADDVAAIIAQEVDAARDGTEIRNGDVVVWASMEQMEQALAQTRQVVSRLAVAGLAVDPQGITVRPAAPEKEWRDAWKRYFRPARLTRQLVVVPSWETFEPAADDLIIRLDPGLAFGTGLHATTRLVLGEMQALRDRGVEITRFLDLGCGSGILAIAAARLWPRATGVALDIDPHAVAAAADNAADNQVGERIVCIHDDPAGGEPGESFELVLANIQSGILLSLRDYLATHTREGGILLLSGILGSQVDAVAAGFQEDGRFEVEMAQYTSAPESGTASEMAPEIDRAGASLSDDWGCVRLVRVGSS